MSGSNATSPRRAKAIGLHLGLVGLSFVLSIGILRDVGLVDGEVIECMFIGTLITHGAAAFVALFLRRVTWASCIMILGIPFLPAGDELMSRVRGSYRMRHVLPGDRFQDHLSSPVPVSVTNLRFVPLSQSRRPDLIFQFDIATADMDEILVQRGFKRVSPDQLLRHDDLFRDPAYLSLGADDQLFQAKDMGGTVMVIKTNAARTHAVFRRG